MRHESARIILAVVSGAGSALTLAAGIAFLLGWFAHWATVPWWHLALQVLGYELPITLLAGLSAVFLYRLILVRSVDEECRCRRCGYILKGLSKPECSECGEAI
jgi:hypothetical protein